MVREGGQATRSLGDAEICLGGHDRLLEVPPTSVEFITEARGAVSFLRPKYV